MPNSQVINILTPEVEKCLLKLARSALNEYFKSRKKKSLKDTDIKLPVLKKKRGTFVTLTKENQLRGCIGHVHAIQEIYKDVLENTYAAAFNDPRFPPLTQEELKDTRIEISILSTPQKLDYKNAQELIKNLSDNNPGVILQKGFNTATFLPQVWEEIEEVENFLSHLCVKAGLNPDEWRQESLTIFTYTVEKVKEK